MGAWSEHTFGNDAACDWVFGFLENPSIERLEKEIDSFLSENGYLDSYASCLCLAASEVLARLLGNWGRQDSYSEKLDTWVKQNPMEVPCDLLGKSQKAVSMILGESSELRGLWDDDPDWLDAVNDLSHRVQTDKPNS